MITEVQEGVDAQLEFVSERPVSMSEDTRKRRDLCNRTTPLVVRLNGMLMDSHKDGLTPRNARVVTPADSTKPPYVEIEWFAPGE